MLCSSDAVTRTPTSTLSPSTILSHGLETAIFIMPYNAAAQTATLLAECALKSSWHAV